MLEAEERANQGREGDDENSITTGGVTTNSVIRLPNGLSVREAKSTPPLDLAAQSV